MQDRQGDIGPGAWSLEPGSHISFFAARRRAFWRIEIVCKRPPGFYQKSAFAEATASRRSGSGPEGLRPGGRSELGTLARGFGTASKKPRGNARVYPIATATFSLLDSTFVF